MKPKSQERTQPRDEKQQQGVDDERQQPECQDVQRKRDDSHHGSDGAVDETKDGCRDQQRREENPHVAAAGGERLAVSNERDTDTHCGGDPQGDGVNECRENEPAHGTIMTPHRHETVDSG